MSEAKLPPTKKTKVTPAPARTEVQSASSRSDKPPRKIAPWERGARTAFRRALYVAAPVFLWMILSLLDLISLSLSTNLSLCFSVLLYLLGIPLSILFGLDSFALEWAPESSNELIMLVFLVVMGLNFTLIGAVRGWLRGEEQEEVKGA